jgi:ABC-type transport system involved in multi-copper enzyme maturation permease subunit
MAGLTPLGDVLAAEWRKLVSVRSTTVLVALSVVSAGLAALIAIQVDVLWDRAPAAARAEGYVSDLSALTGWGVQLCMALLGVLAVTAEYSSGMIRTTFTVVPRRGRVLAGKAVAAGGLALGAGLVAPSVAYGLVRLILGDRHVPGAYAPLREQLGLGLATGLLTAVYALVGVGLGTVLRHAAGAIVAIVALWYLLPILAIHLPAPWADRVAAMLLPNLARHGLTWTGLVGMALYAGVPLAAAALVLHRRDAG